VKLNNQFNLLISPIPSPANEAYRKTIKIQKSIGVLSRNIYKLD